MDAPRRASDRRPLVLIALLVGAPLAIAVGVVWFRACFVPSVSCGNEIVAERTAPDAARRAVVFRRNCGATTPYSTNVTVLPAGDALPDAAGNVLVLRDLRDVAVDWTDATHLVVHYPQGVEPFVASQQVDGVTVSLAPR
jgi:hypothetical protein